MNKTFSIWSILLRCGIANILVVFLALKNTFLLTYSRRLEENPLFRPNSSCHAFFFCIFVCAFPFFLSFLFVYQFSCFLLFLTHSFFLFLFTYSFEGVNNGEKKKRKPCNYRNKWQSKKQSHANDIPSVQRGTFLEKNGTTDKLLFFRNRFIDRGGC